MGTEKVVDTGRVYMKRWTDAAWHVISARKGASLCGLEVDGEGIWENLPPFEEAPRRHFVCGDCMRMLETDAPSPRPSEIDPPYVPIADRVGAPYVPIADRLAERANLHAVPSARPSETEATSARPSEIDYQLFEVHEVTRSVSARFVTSEGEEVSVGVVAERKVVNGQQGDWPAPIFHLNAYAARLGRSDVEKLVAVVCDLFDRYDLKFSAKGKG